MNDNDQMPSLFQRLSGLRDECKGAGCNKHDQVKVLLAAAMDDGIAIGSELVGVVASLRFNPRHVGKVLHDNVGHLWHRDGNRFYTALSPLSSEG